MFKEFQSRVRDRLPDRRRIEVRLRRTREFLAALLENPLTLVGIVIVVSFILLALATPYLMPPERASDPYNMPRDWRAADSPPGTADHPLGTTSRGGDVLYGILWGARLSIALSIVVVFSTAVIGTILGGIAGYLGGWVDDALMRVVDGLIAIPPLIFAMALLVAIGPSYQNIALALIAMLWGSYARIIRGEVIHVKNEDYVDAARAVGVGETSVLLKEVIPNAVPPIFVQSTLYFGRVVLIAAALAFIGLAESGITEWGVMISLGQEGLLAGRWWTSFFPGLAIFLWAFGWNMIGDGLRDLLDPRSRSE